MAGRGPAPKDPSRRARTNSDPVPLRVIHAIPTEQPELPEFDIQVGSVDGEITYETYRWHSRTRQWWREWAESPLSADLTQTDWSYLLDTAFIHSEYWHGNLKLAGELRLRVAKFGATPEDRARLRIHFAAADDAEDRQPTTQPRAQDIYKGLRLADE